MAIVNNVFCAGRYTPVLCALSLWMLQACGSKSPLLEPEEGAGTVTDCGGANCSQGEACIYCPGGQASCELPAALPPCAGALIVECRSDADCDLGNQCTLRLGGTFGYVSCTSLDLPCGPPSECQRACASTAECYPGQSCVPAVLKYGEIDVCQGGE